MKIFKIITFVLIAISALGFNEANLPNGSGINFFKGTWNEALQKARSEKQYFLDIYATWCGPCKQLKRKTFKDPEVGTYYNKNFINVSIDGESKEGLELADKYQVASYPTLFIIDADGKKMTKATGFMEPHILVNFGRRIVP